jgi:hypothetical protein
VVLENAGTIVLYTKRCFSFTVIFVFRVLRALVSEEQGELHDANLCGDV